MKKIGLDFLKEVSFISQLKGNGDYLSYIVSKTNMDKNKYDSNIYLYDILNDNHRKLTCGNDDKNYLWLNSNEIMFKSKREEPVKNINRTTYYKINIHGGEAEMFMDLPYDVKAIEMVNENQYFFTASFNEKSDKVKELEGHDKEEYLSALEEEEDYEVIEEIPFWNNGGSYSRGSRTALYSYNKETETTTKLSSEKLDVVSFNYESDYDELFLIGKEFIGKSEVYNQLYKLDNDKFTLINISHQKDYSYKKMIQVAENDLIVYGSDMKEYGLNENGKFGSLNIMNNEYKCLTPDLVDSTSNAVGSDLRIGNISSGYAKDSKGIYFTILDNFTNKIMNLSFDGVLREIKDTESCVDEYVLHEDEIFFIGLKGNSPQEIYKMNNLERISSFNQKLLEDYSISTPEHIEFKNREGILVDGFIMKPIKFDVNNKYPLILNIHGGPKTAYGNILYHEMQHWANEGFGVIYCNPRGSDGKGSDFSDIRGKYGDIDYNDIMDFVDCIISEYEWVDKERLGVTGGSYGGFMTNWIIGHTNRFKVAASQRSISNWISFYGTSDIGYYFASDQTNSTPWSDVDNMWKQSPLKYADKVETPTLFIHSKNDYRCWTPEAYQMFTALKFFGIESRLVLFDGENHELSRSGKPKHRIRRLKELTNWIKKYLET